MLGNDNVSEKVDKLLLKSEISRCASPNGKGGNKRNLLANKQRINKLTRQGLQHRQDKFLSKGRYGGAILK